MSETQRKEALKDLESLLGKIGISGEIKVYGKIDYGTRSIHMDVNGEEIASLCVSLPLSLSYYKMGIALVPISSN